MEHILKTAKILAESYSLGSRHNDHLIRTSERALRLVKKASFPYPRVDGSDYSIAAGDGAEGGMTPSAFRLLARSVAYLHDILEDGVRSTHGWDISSGSLGDELVANTDESHKTVTFFRAVSIIKEAVQILTRSSDEKRLYYDRHGLGSTYANHIIDIAKAPGGPGALARLVKSADLLDHLTRVENINHLVQSGKKKQYERALYHLTGASSYRKGKKWVAIPHSSCSVFSRSE